MHHENYIAQPFSLPHSPVSLFSKWHITKYKVFRKLGGGLN